MALSRDAAELITVANVLRWQDPNYGSMAHIAHSVGFCVILCLDMAHFSLSILCNKILNGKDVVSHLFCLHCQGQVIHDSYI